MIYKREKILFSVIEIHKSSSLRHCIQLLIFHKLSPSGQIVNGTSRASPPEEDFSPGQSMPGEYCVFENSHLFFLHPHSRRTPTICGNFSQTSNMTEFSWLYYDPAYISYKPGLMNLKGFAVRTEFLRETHMRNTPGSPGTNGASIFPKTHAHGFLVYQ